MNWIKHSKIIQDAPPFVNTSCRCQNRLAPDRYAVDTVATASLSSARMSSAGETVVPIRSHHIGIAVRSLDTALAWYRDLLGADLHRIDEVPTESVRVAHLTLGGLQIELLEPTAPGAIQEFIDRRGPGVHHVAYGVDDIELALKRVEAGGLTIVKPGIRKGSNGSQIFFVHPKDSGGVLWEFTTMSVAE